MVKQSSTMRANNADGVSAVTLGAGFSSKHGSIFRAYVHGDSYCAPFSYDQRTMPGSNTPPLLTKPSRPVYSKRVNSQKLSSPSKSIGISLYPNPSSGSLYYVINDNSVYNYTVTDLMGKVLKTGSLTSKVNELDLSIFEKGMYLVTVSNETYIQTDRIILE